MLVRMKLTMLEFPTGLIGSKSSGLPDLRLLFGGAWDCLRSLGTNAFPATAGRWPGLEDGPLNEVVHPGILENFNILDPNQYLDLLSFFSELLQTQIDHGRHLRSGQGLASSRSRPEHSRRDGGLVAHQQHHGTRKTITKQYIPFSVRVAPGADGCQGSPLELQAFGHVWEQAFP
jgi:hypothetical protein